MEKKSVIFQWNFEKERDADLISQFGPIYLLMGSYILEEDGSETNISQVESVENMVKNIEDMIINSDCPSTWKITFERCG